MHIHCVEMVPHKMSSTPLLVVKTGSVSEDFSPGALPILMSGADCHGSESRLINCNFVDSTSDCSHSNDIHVGIHCQPGKL